MSSSRLCEPLPSRRHRPWAEKVGRTPCHDDEIHSARRPHGGHRAEPRHRHGVTSATRRDPRRHRAPGLGAGIAGGSSPDLTPCPWLARGAPRPGLVAGRPRGGMMPYDRFRPAPPTPAGDELTEECARILEVRRALSARSSTMDRWLRVAHPRWAAAPVRGARAAVRGRSSPCLRAGAACHVHCHGRRSTLSSRRAATVESMDSTDGDLTMPRAGAGRGG